eukprot:7378236-Prymnesium_polylepis.1
MERVGWVRLACDGLPFGVCRGMAWRGVSDVAFAGLGCGTAHLRQAPEFPHRRPGAPLHVGEVSHF